LALTLIVRHEECRVNWKLVAREGDITLVDRSPVLESGSPNETGLPHMAATAIQDAYAQQVFTHNAQHLDSSPVEETGHGVVIGKHHADATNL
jgi:hypothetical protein